MRLELEGEKKLLYAMNNKNNEVHTVHFTLLLNEMHVTLFFPLGCRNCLFWGIIVTASLPLRSHSILWFQEDIISATKRTSSADHISIKPQPLPPPCIKYNPPHLWE